MYVFGYGSIINKQTRSHSFGGDIPVRVHGYERDWNARVWSDGATALGITAKHGSTCNGVLVEVSPALLSELDEREERDGYRRETISSDCIESLAGKIDSSKKIYTYIPIEPMLANEDFPIEQTYIDVVLCGCFQHGEDFLREFIRTTRSWNYPRLHDREAPNYSRWKPEYVLESVETIFAQSTIPTK